jgi:hypothetical protein
MNICDPLARTADELLLAIGRGLAASGSNGFLHQLPFSEVLVGINPVWAEVIGRQYPDIGDVQERLCATARLPLGDWPERYHAEFEEADRVRDGHVHLVIDADKVLVTVAGGMGGLHAAALHSWGSTKAITRAIASALHHWPASACSTRGCCTPDR